VNVTPIFSQYVLVLGNDLPVYRIVNAAYVSPHLVSNYLRTDHDVDVRHGAEEYIGVGGIGLSDIHDLTFQFLSRLEQRECDSPHTLTLFELELRPLTLVGFRTEGNYSNTHNDRPFIQILSE
jgi:hypothetical protein